MDGVLENPLSQNGYSYAHDNPINLADPSGEMINQIVQYCANSAAAGAKLAKSLASQQQVSETGKVIAGQGAAVFRDAAAVAQQHGGNAADWVKKGKLCLRCGRWH